MTLPITPEVYDAFARTVTQNSLFFTLFIKSCIFHTSLLALMRKKTFQTQALIFFLLSSHLLGKLDISPRRIQNYDGSVVKNFQFMKSQVSLDFNTIQKKNLQIRQNQCRSTARTKLHHVDSIIHFVIFAENVDLGINDKLQSLNEATSVIPHFIRTRNQSGEVKV